MSEAIQIHGRSFPLVLDTSGVEHVKLGELCDPFGLDMSGQRVRLKNTGWGRVEKIYTRRSDGKRTGFLCLPLRRVAMFFATLQPKHVNAGFRPALIEMQAEAADAIDDYYRKGGAIRPTAPPAQLEALLLHIEEVLREVPLTDPAWPASFVKRYEAWNGRVWKLGDRQPFSMKSANWFFYEMIFAHEVLAVIKARGLQAGVRYHQVLADAPRDYLLRNLEFASKLANDCGSEAEWRTRMRRAYEKTKADNAGQASLSL